MSTLLCVERLGYKGEMKEDQGLQLYCWGQESSIRYALMLLPHFDARKCPND